MPTVIIVRHGQTHYNAQGLLQGRLDIPLNPVGEEQARRVAHYLKENYKIDALYSSPLQRAFKTGQAIAHLQACPQSAHPELQEIDMGQLEGLSRTETLVTHKEYYQQQLRDPYSTPIPGGESFGQVYDRVGKWVKANIEVKEQEGKTLCIVSHAGPVRALLAHALGLPGASPTPFRLVTANTGVSTIKFDRQAGQWQVHLFNSIAHLQ